MLEDVLVKIALLQNRDHRRRVRLPPPRRTRAPNSSAPCRERLGRRALRANQFEDAKQSALPWMPEWSGTPVCPRCVQQTQSQSPDSIQRAKLVAGVADTGLVTNICLVIDCDWETIRQDSLGVLERAGARPPQVPLSCRSTNGRLRVHRGMVQPPTAPLRHRIPVTSQLRTEPATPRSPKSITVHENGASPSQAQPLALR